MIFRQTPAADACALLLQSAMFGMRKPVRPPLDPRIEIVLKMMKGASLVGQPLEFLAAAVNLSEGRLLHLFTEQIGIPFRRYRSWVRLRHVSRRHFEGCDLTSAAYEAGFSDSSHYVRTFRSFFGTKPTHFLSRRRDATIFFG